MPRRDKPSGIPEDHLHKGLARPFIDADGYHFADPRFAEGDRIARKYGMRMAAVTFGTTVIKALTHSISTFTTPTVTVTSGQPVILTVMIAITSTIAAPTPSISWSSSGFSTPYSFLAIDSGTSGGTNANYVKVWMYVAYGGVGTSGTFTVTGLNSNTYYNWGGSATPCIGASTGTTLATIIDVYGDVSSPSASTTIASPSLTPTAGTDGAVYAGLCSQSGYPLTAAPSSPWVNTYIALGLNNFGAVDTDSGPTQGSALSTTWTQTNSVVYTSIGCLVLAASGGVTAGTAAATDTLTGVAVGAVIVPGTAGATETLSGTAVGQVTVAGTAAATDTLTGGAAGVVGVAGTAASSATFTAGATGTLAATASTSATLTNSAIGVITVPGTASTSASLTALAVGVVVVPGTAPISATLTGTATATLAVPASATSAFTFTGVATGTVTVPATATTSTNLTATAAGTSTTTVAGTGAASAAITAVATGVVVVPATVSTSASLAAVATGLVVVTATAAVSTTLIAVAAGSIVSTVAGIGSASATFTVSAVGKVVIVGATSATGTLTATAVGKVYCSATAAGIGVLTASATGRALVDLGILIAGRSFESWLANELFSSWYTLSKPFSSGAGTDWECSSLSSDWRVG